MLFERTVSKGDVVSFDTPTPEYRSIVAVTRNEKDEITSELILKPQMDGSHRLEVFSPDILLADIAHTYPTSKNYTLQDVKRAFYRLHPTYGVTSLRIPLMDGAQERSLIASIIEQVSDFKPELSYDDITVSLGYAGVWFRYVCDDNPEDGGYYADEEDAHKLLNCVLIATIARQNTEPFVHRYPEWKLAMAEFVRELLEGDGFKIRSDSKALTWFKKRIDSATSFEELRPNN